MRWEPFGDLATPHEMKGFQALTLSVNAPRCTWKEPGEFRIFVMGDFVIFPIGVEYEDAVAYQVERIANGSMLLSVRGLFRHSDDVCGCLKWTALAVSSIARFL